MPCLQTRVRVSATTAMILHHTNRTAANIPAMSGRYEHMRECRVSLLSKLQMTRRARNLQGR